VAHARSEGRTVAAEKSKKVKKAKGKKAKKAKKAAKAKAKAKGKKAKKAAGKVKGKKAKKVASAKKPKSHAPERLSVPDEAAADPAENFEISPEMQDELPEPNNGDLTD
jgi:hypothetical protein